MTAAESKEYGFIDEVLNRNNLKETKSKKGIDPAKFEA
jgi:ATP-dependent protease ClpP protease subunit